MREHVETFGLTDRGRQRRRNEDAILYPPLEIDLFDETHWLLAVADGVGGGPAGEVASHVAIRALLLAKKHWPEDAPYVLQSLFAEANTAIALSAVDGDAGMATTLVAALMSNTRLWVANVGDSRAYVVTLQGILRLTRDHTWVAERVKAGYMTEAEAAESPQRNLITRSLGDDGGSGADIFGPYPLTPDDVVVLCSDGLHAVVADHEIGAACYRSSVEEAAHRLVCLANERGGPDNVSVVIARSGHHG